MWCAPMRRSTKNALTLIALAAVSGAGYYGYLAAKRVVKSDPLANYKEPPSAQPRNIAVETTNTTFKRFEAGLPQASCDVQRMEIASNRQVYNFFQVTNGKVIQDGKTYQFSAERGNWNGFNKLLTINGKSKLKGPKFDLNSTSVAYNEPQQSFTVQGAVKGTLYGGKLEVNRVFYSMRNSSFTTGKGVWSGIVPAEFQEGSNSRRTWTISSDGSKSTGKDTTAHTNARATDGEVIIVAPNVTHDRKSEILTCTGRVRYFGAKANLIADKIVVYRKERRAMVTGNVLMLAKPKSAEDSKPKEEEITPFVPESVEGFGKIPVDSEERKKKEELIRSSKNLRDYPLIITAKQIEYWYKKGERRALISGKPQARQELPDKAWRYGWSDTAKYDGEKEILELFSEKGSRNVTMRNSLGDELIAEWASLVTQEGSDEYEYRKGTIRMTIEDDEDIPRENKGSTGGGTGGSTGGGLRGPIRRG
jgi:lipopolysaccharide export system protein LptA